MACGLIRSESFNPGCKYQTSYMLMICPEFHLGVATLCNRDAYATEETASRPKDEKKGRLKRSSSQLPGHTGLPQYAGSALF